METGDQASLLEAEEIQEKVHLESLRIVQEERSIQAKFALEECSLIELEQFMSVQLEEMYDVLLLIKTLKQHAHMEQTHQAQVEESSQICGETWQQLDDSMAQISSKVNMTLQENYERIEVISSQQQEINELQERKHEQELLHTKQQHQLGNDVQAETAREATDLKNAKKVKARLQKRWEVESQQKSARRSQLAGVRSKQLISSTAEVGTRTTVLQKINEELPEEGVEMTLLQEEVTAMQHIQVLESRWRVSVSELEQVQAHYMELKTALEVVERDEPGAECNLQLSETEIGALKNLMERLGAELVKLQTKTELLGSLQECQIGELKIRLQLKQQHLLTVQQSLAVQQEECKKAEKNAKVNCQQISQLQTQEEE